MKQPKAMTPRATFGMSEREGWRQHWYTIIFEADTPAGRNFDLWLLAAIAASVAVVILDSVAEVRAVIGLPLRILEWCFTLLFTLEYVVRLMVVQRPLRYALSLYGVVDLLAVLPTYLAFFFPELYALIDVRLLRLLRIFRIMKIPLYFDEAQVLMRALAAAHRKILVFLAAVGIIVVILGTIMYVVEGPEHGFRNIPVSIYWAVVTLSTTGFGDLVPRTAVGQFITSVTIMLGYGIIAFPTGILGAELAATMLRRHVTARRCAACLTEGHETDALYCRRCGAELPSLSPSSPEVR